MEADKMKPLLLKEKIPKREKKHRLPVRFRNFFLIPMRITAAKSHT
jgi:hypothetical protein